MKKTLKIVTKIFWFSIATTLVVTFLTASYEFGYRDGLYQAVNLSSELSSPGPETKQTSVSPTPKKPEYSNLNGPDLWTAVNKRRTQMGVNPLGSREEICTIASIRLNQLLELGKLDAHEGFSKLPETRTDLKWIFDKYNLSEFLVSGASSADEAVSLWENTLGHKQLLTGGEYVWGCIYAQNGFGVAIAAY